MREERRVRLVRKREPGTDAASTAEAERPGRREPSEREIKTVVTRWVRDHRQRSEEFRKTFAALLRAGEVQLPTR